MPGRYIAVGLYSGVAAKRGSTVHRAYGVHNAAIDLCFL